MAFYGAEWGAIAGVNSADGVLANIKAGATVPLFIYRLFFGIEVASTSVPIFGAKKMNAVGTGSITTSTPFAMDGLGGTSAATIETAWATTRPTVTGGNFLRGVVPTAIGNGFLFDFSRKPLVIPINTALCLLMRGAAGATVGSFSGDVHYED